MAITTALTNVFKNELLSGSHDFYNHAFKIAFYNEGEEQNPINLTQTTTNYFTQWEITAVGYTAGGYDVSPQLLITEEEISVNVADQTIPNLIENNLHGALLYNSSLTTNNAVAVFDLGNAVVNGELIVRWSLYPIFSVR